MLVKRDVKQGRSMEVADQSLIDKPLSGDWISKSDLMLNWNDQNRTPASKEPAFF